MGGDLDSLFDLTTLKNPPLIIYENFIKDFEFVNLRNESTFLNISTKIFTNISIYENDPIVPIRIDLILKEFQILVNILNSISKILFGVDDINSLISIKIEIHSNSKDRTEISLKINFPNLISFITQEQINFFIKFSSLELQIFSADKIIDKPLAFQNFEINTTK